VQIIVQAACSRGPSLRDAIRQDPRLARFGLRLSEVKRKGRRSGWTKVHGAERSLSGAANIEWHAASSVLLCRVVTRSTDPAPLAGAFLTYLLSRYKKRVQSVHVVYA